MGAVDDSGALAVSRGKNTLPDDKHLGEFVRLQIAFANCLRMTLRRETNADQLSRYLAPDDLRKVMDANSPANRILLIMGNGWPYGGVAGTFQTFCFTASTTA